jgi:hypothetical protein
MKIIFAVAPLVILAGCVGTSLGDIRENDPVYAVKSAKKTDQLLMCLMQNEDLSEFRGDGRLHVLTLPEKKDTEITIGAQQAGKFRYFYRILVAHTPAGTLLELRRSPTDFSPMAQDELVRIVTQCA